MYSKLSLICDQCKNSIQEEIFVPDTNMDDGEGVFCEGSISCQECGKRFELNINNKGGIVLVTANGVHLESEAASPLDILSEYDLLDENDFPWYLTIGQKTVYQYSSASINSLKDLLELQIHNSHHEAVFCRMILVQAIAVMEAYLSDTLISRVLNNQNELKQLFEYDKVLLNEKYSMVDFLNEKKLPQRRAKEYLSELVYHNLPKINSLYRNILGIDLNYGTSTDKNDLFFAIQIRHDCVHRNGKNKDGQYLKIIDKQYVFRIINIIEAFIVRLDDILREFDDIPF